MNRFVVLSFDEEGSVSVAPHSWYDENKKTCSWPKVTAPSKLKKLIMSMAEPDENWLQIKARALCYADTYAKAKAKERKAEDTSDLCSTDTEVSHKRGKKTHATTTPILPTFPDDVATLPSTLTHVHTDRHTSRAQTPTYPNIHTLATQSQLYLNTPTTQPQILPLATQSPVNSNIHRSPQIYTTLNTPIYKSLPTPTYTHFATSSPLHLSPSTSFRLPSPPPSASGADQQQSSQNEILHNSSQTDYQPVSSVQSCSCKESNQVFQRKVLTALEHIKADIRSLENKVDQILPQNTHKKVLPENCPVLPVQSSNDLADFNTFAGSKTNFSKLCGYFGCIGGSCVKDTVRRILQRIMTNDLSTLYNWKGTGGKKLAFESYSNVIKLITNSVRLHTLFDNATNHEVEEAIKKWLVHAKDRNGGRGKRRDNAEVTATNEPERESNEEA